MEGVSDRVAFNAALFNYFVLIIIAQLLSEYNLFELEILLKYSRVGSTVTAA